MSLLPRDFKSCARWVVVGILLYAAVLFGTCVMMYRSFSYGDFDLAVHAQVMWNLIHGSGESSILGFHFLGNHAHLIAYLLVPFYALVPHPLTLVFLQALALGAGAWPLFRLTSRIIGPRWGCFVSLAYWLYPGLTYTGLFEYHPPAFATFFLGMAALAYFEKRFRAFIVFMLLSMACQENIPFIFVAWGVYAAVERRSRRWVLSSFLGGCLAAGFLVGWFIPHFARGSIHFASIYSSLGESYFEILRNLLTRPDRVLPVLLEPAKVLFLVDIFSPLFFVPWMRPGALFLAGPLFLQHLLSGRAKEVTVLFHYTAELIPLIFVAFIFGLERLRQLPPLRRRPILLVAPLIFHIFFYGLQEGPWPRMVRGWQNHYRRSERDRVRESFVGRIPPRDGVVATFEFLPHLAGRAHLYSFHHVYYGFYTLSDNPYLLPSQASWALIDLRDPLTFRGFYSREASGNFRDFLAQGWGIVGYEDDMILARKGVASREDLCRVLEQPPAPRVPVDRTIFGTLTFLGYDLEEISPGGLEMVLYWKAVRGIAGEMSLVFEVIDAQGRTTFAVKSPLGRRVFPAREWPLGEVVAERVSVRWPSRAFSGTGTIRMGLYHEFFKRWLPLDPEDARGRLTLQRTIEGARP